MSGNKTGLSSGAMWTAALSMIADYFPNEKQGSVYSYVNISMGVGCLVAIVDSEQAGVLLGPVIGGSMMDLFDNQKEYPFLFVVAIAGIRHHFQRAGEESFLPLVDVVKSRTG